jgi:hypothetical protein
VSYDPEPELEHYLERLSSAAHDLPKRRRGELLSEIEQHIREALARTPPADRDEMATLLEQVGDPAEIAAAADDQADAGLAGGLAPRRARRPRKLIIALVALAVIGLAIGAASWIQSYQPLAFAPADVLTPNSVNTFGENGRGAWVGYSNGIGGPHRPFFGVTIQNTGHFTVRVDGIGTYAPLLPLLRGWSSRLLMARGAFVQEPVRDPAGKIVRDVNGHSMHRRVWKRERLRPFQAVDLAPGQIVMIVLRGVWHMDCLRNVSVGSTTPPQSFPVRYSFLWKTTTTHIPLPGGLRIAPPNHHPGTDCRQRHVKG